MIVLFDSNIWVSLAINRQLDFIASLNKSNITLITCENLVDELINVLLRPKFKKNFTKDYIERFVQFHQLSTSTFEILDIEPVVTDKKDDYLFALCKIANADYFVTGDKLLLAVHEFYVTNIITLADFKNMLKVID